MKTNTPNGKINFIRQGQGLPVILIHGMGASLQSWQYLNPDLVAAGYQVLALDLPGHGDSFKPEDPQAYHIEQIYQELESWISGLNLSGQFLLVGHSVGGYLSCLFAIRRPQQIAALVLLDPFYSRNQLYPLMQLTVNQPKIGVKVLESTPDWAIRSAISWSRNFAYPIPAPALQQAIHDLTRATPKILYIAPTVLDLSDQVSRIMAPTLVIWGNRDMTLSPKSFPPLIESIPNATGIEIAQCGHTPHLNQFQKVNPLITDFFLSNTNHS